jgi:hypothetical protein
MAEISTQEQIVREAPEIEAQKLALLQSAKAQVDATNLAAQQGNFLTPNYQIAGMTQNQLDAIRGGEAGIGAYQPYLSNAARQLVGGQQTTGAAVDVLRGADTRAQFGAAQGFNRARGSRDFERGATYWAGSNLPVHEPVHEYCFATAIR